MMRSSVYHVLEEMDKLEKEADRYSDKAWEKAQNGNMKAADHYDQKSDLALAKIQGIKSALKILGFGVWKDNTGHWHIPLDDIERVC